MAETVLCGAGGLPMWPTTLILSQTIPTGYRASIQGTLTITSVTLNIEGTGYLTISSTLILK
jgi:hypothetical protein